MTDKQLMELMNLRKRCEAQRKEINKLRGRETKWLVVQHLNELEFTYVFGTYKAAAEFLSTTNCEADRKRGSIFDLKVRENGEEWTIEENV